LAAHYRYLFRTRNPKLFPFVGASPGFGIAHTSSGNIQFGSATNTRFTFRGEAGLKCFVARNVSVEAAYNLHYVRNTDFGSFAGSSASASALVFGLAFTF
jgi:opacity protein-like surface antigen